jgi:UDP-2,4-diacetamido-2,4,6-trideoxy-beta-L-altropyranose hydrolase
VDIRPATIEDAFHLFHWRNDALTRAMSKNSDAVAWPDHVKWLTARLEKPGLFIAEVDRVPVGTFRVDDGEISYTVAPEYRRKGYGLAMLNKAREMFGPLRAEIFPHNTASMKIAEQAGMLVAVLQPRE